MTLEALPVMSFTQVINNHVERGRRTREGPQPAWYPSSIGGCERKSVLRRAGIKSKPFDIRTLRKFWMGDQVHHAVQSAVEQELLLSKAGFEFLGHELIVRDDQFHLSGRLDSMVRAADAKTEAWEYKSIASSAFQYHDRPKPEHILQLGIYGTFPARRIDATEASMRPCPKAPQPLSHNTRGANRDGIEACEYCGAILTRPGFWPIPDRGRIIYWSKDDALMEEYVVNFTDELRANVKKTLGRLEAHYQAYLKDKTLPPIIPLRQVAILDKVTGERVPQAYLRAGKYGKKGDPKLERDPRTKWCDYEGLGQCCLDGVDKLPRMGTEEEETE